MIGGRTCDRSRRERRLDRDAARDRLLDRFEEEVRRWHPDWTWIRIMREARKMLKETR